MGKDSVKLSELKKNDTNPEFREIQSDRIIVNDWQSSSWGEWAAVIGALMVDDGRRIHSFS